MTRISRILSITALSVAAAFVTLAGLFIAGYAFADVGGWAAVGLVSVWMVPLAVLSLVARVWPEGAGWVLGAGLVLVGITSFFFAADNDWWRRLMDDVGPLLGVTAFVLILPLAIFGLRRQFAAGAMLVLLALMPYVAFLATITDEPWRGLGTTLTTSSTAATVPVLVVGALLLLAALLGRNPSSASAGPDDGAAPTERSSVAAGR